ncbi:MAG: peptidoglycan DD-metalloendopeptidase family protein [Pseudomonadota bacterium]
MKLPPRRVGVALAAWATLLLLNACVIVTQDDTPYQPAKPTHYTVLPGDTLYSIAFRLKLDWRDLARWNGLDNPSLIHPGQRLVLSEPSGAKRRSKSTRVARGTPPSTSSRSPTPKPSTKPPKGTAATPAPTSPPKRTPAPTNSVASSLSWRWPASGPLVATFSDPAEAGRGIDVGGKKGDGVRAAASGRVVYTGSGLRYYGNLVIIKHDDTFLSAYGYNDALLVSQGDDVRAGQRIARMGLGPGQQPRLHFEIRVNGKPVDPLRYLPARDRGR